MTECIEFSAVDGREFSTHLPIISTNLLQKHVIHPVKPIFATLSSLCLARTHFSLSSLPPLYNACTHTSSMASRPLSHAYAEREYLIDKLGHLLAAPLGGEQMMRHFLRRADAVGKKFCVSMIMNPKVARWWNLRMTTVLSIGRSFPQSRPDNYFSLQKEEKMSFQAFLLTFCLKKAPPVTSSTFPLSSSPLSPPKRP